MKKNSLVPNKGLSLSQAQSISNLCNQRAREIEAKFIGVNNVSKKVKIGKEEHIILEGNKMPDNVIELLSEKAKLHACQAFLMENIKAKDTLLQQINVVQVDISDISENGPEQPKYVNPANEQLTPVVENWGWEQLSISEYNEYLEAEAYAAHIGQFIHKGNILDVLRKELPTIKPTEWMTIKDNEKSPVKVVTHHQSEELLALHEKLAAVHRNHEQRVNYFKAKVKNLVTKENARIAKINADLQNEAQTENNKLRLEYETKLKEVNEKIKTKIAEFEEKRQKSIMEIASMRINVDSRFQEIVDEFLGQLVEVKSE